MSAAPHLAERVAAWDWGSLHGQLDAEGYAVTPILLDPALRRELIERYDDAAQFRSRVVMQRHNFGRGEYQYFAYPLPAAVQTLRAAVYAQLAPLANEWADRLGQPTRYPAQLDDFLASCHDVGQRRPTPLLLRYGAGDYNCLHQDLYGDHAFPLQLIFLLNEPGQDFEGGELVLVEQRPRMQSVPKVVSLPAGAAAIIAVHQRPVQGVRGWYRSQLRHGVSRVRAGRRHTLGLVMHDAR